MLNKVVLMGRLTRDPEARSTQSGTSMCTFSLAVDRSFARQGEERQTDFINIIAFRSTADFVLRYFRKGQLVAVCGRLQTRNWQDQNGNNRTATEVLAEEVHFAEKKRDDNGYGDSFGQGFSAPAPGGGYNSQGGGFAPQSGGFDNFGGSAPSGFTADEGDDSDLPF